MRHPQVLPTFASIARFVDMSKNAGELSMFGQVADAIGENELAQALREAPLGAAQVAKLLKAVALQAWAEGMQPAFRNQKIRELHRSDDPHCPYEVLVKRSVSDASVQQESARAS